MTQFQLQRIGLYTEVNNELERIRDEAATAYSNVLMQHIFAETYDNTS